MNAYTVGKIIYRLETEEEAGCKLNFIVTGAIFSGEVRYFDVLDDATKYAKKLLSNNPTIHSITIETRRI